MDFAMFALMGVALFCSVKKWWIAAYALFFLSLLVALGFILPFVPAELGVRL